MNGEPSENPDRTRVRFPSSPGVAAPATPASQDSLEQTVPLAAATEFAPDLPAPSDAPARPASTEVKYGTVLSGRYRIEEELGSGGMAIVYAAADLRMPGVRVAIKLLQPE